MGVGAPPVKIMYGRELSSPGDYHLRKPVKNAPPPRNFPPMKGDKQWLADGECTPLTQCDCAMCQGKFRGHPSAKICPGCDQSAHPDELRVGHDAQWLSTLRTDTPRPVPNPGKVAERQRCPLCGALGPHTCPARDLPVEFDSPRDREMVGFRDKGKRRHQPIAHSQYPPCKT